MNQSITCCRMCSWYDDITLLHNEETDDLHIGENDFKDLAMDRSPLTRLFSVVGSRASLTSTSHDEDKQRSHSYSESFTDAECRQNN